MLLQKVINSAGLFFDIIGACLVAWEVINQFTGNKIKSSGAQWGAKPATESFEYKDWERKKYFKMKFGLIFLLFGFILQIISNWI